MTACKPARRAIFGLRQRAARADLVDFVSAESFKAGKAAADYVQGKARKGSYVALKDGEGVRGVVPQRLLKPEGEAQSVQVMFRPAGVYENATLCVMDGDREVLPAAQAHPHPPARWRS